jgi:multiple sugar transport system permease protein
LGKLRNRLSSVPSAIFIALMFIFFFGPIFFLIISSFKTYHDLTSLKLIVFFKPSLENYEYIVYTKNILRYLYNSLIISSFTIVGILPMSFFAAYSLAKFKFKQKENTALDILTFRMMPPVVISIPIYIWFQAVGLQGTYWGVILMHIAFILPFTVWILTGFMMDVPSEVEEAAFVDGCSRAQELRKIVLPLISKGLAVAALFTFIFSWNEYLFSLILTNEATKPLSVYVSTVEARYMINWGELCSSTIFYVAPILVLIWFIQKHIIKGITLGGIKK